MAELPSLSLDEFALAIQDVSQLEIENKKQQQLHFISKLIETNNELNIEVNSASTSPEDIQFFKETIDENKLHLLQQIARVKALNEELNNRGLLSEEEKSKQESNLINEINQRDQTNTQIKDEINEEIYL